MERGNVNGRGNVSDSSVSRYNLLNPHAQRQPYPNYNYNHFNRGASTTRGYNPPASTPYPPRRTYNGYNPVATAAFGPTILGILGDEEELDSAMDQDWRSSTATVSTMPIQTLRDNPQPTLLTELPPLSTLTSLLKCSWCRRFPSGAVWVCEDNHTICDRCMEVNGESGGVIAGCPMRHNVDGSFVRCTSPVTASSNSLLYQLFAQAKFMCPYYNCQKTFYFHDINIHTNTCDKRMSSVGCFSENCSDPIALCDYVGHLKSVHSSPVFDRALNIFNIPFKRDNFEVESVLGMFDCYGEKFLLVKQETKAKYIFFCFVLNKELDYSFYIHFQVLIRGSCVKECVGEVFPLTYSISDLILRDAFTSIRKDSVANSLNTKGEWTLNISINTNLTHSSLDASAVDLPPVATQADPVAISSILVATQSIPVAILPPRVPIPVPQSNLSASSVGQTTNSQVPNATDLGIGIGTCPVVLGVSNESGKDEVDKKPDGVLAKDKVASQLEIKPATPVTNAVAYSSDKVQHNKIAGVPEERKIFTCPESMSDAECLERMAVLRERIDKKDLFFKSLEDHRMSLLRAQPILYKDILDTYDKVEELKQQILKRTLEQFPQYKKFHPNA